MRNIWRLFTGDLRRLRSNVVALIALVGLVALPSIFSWYNMIACWDVFDNTGKLTVAVANCDEGYESDLVVMRVNIGDRVVSALRENEQLNWTFTDEEDAVDGARSGRYYAAVVIPESFSRDMMSFYADDAEHASIIYYSNEKKNAVAPKVTDQGADQISRQINQVFTETLTEVGLSVANALSRTLDNADADGAIGNVAGHLSRAGSQLGESGSILSLYAGVLGSARSLVEDSGALVAQARSSSEPVAKSASEARDGAASAADALAEAADALADAVSQSASNYAELPNAIGAALDSANDLSSETAKQLKTQAGEVGAVASDIRSLAQRFEQMEDGLSEHGQALSPLVARLYAAASSQEQLRDSLDSTAADIEKANGDVQGDRDATVKLAAQAKTDLESAHADFDANLAPALEELGDMLANASASFSGATGKLDAGAQKIIGASGSISERLASYQEKIDGAAKELQRIGDEISGLATGLEQALESGDSDSLRSLLEQDPETLAQAISAPVQLDRHAVFPVENFGSAMSPLYTTLALWIGALLIMVTLKMTFSEKTRAELDDPTLSELFLGRFSTVAFISLLQSTTVSLGNLLFLGVQAVNPALYLLCFWVAGLVFSFIIYTLVALFANFGKAVSVILLIVQVSGGGGSFPLALLPEFFQNVSPYLPITHAVNAMRAAMFGVYQADFWIELGTLGLFVIPFIILGIVLHAPLSKVVPRFIERVEKSKLM